MRLQALIAWSSGKDSAWSLHRVREAQSFDVVGALTTITDTFARVSMHGVREDILAEQLASADLQSVPVRIPYPCPNEAYEAAMSAALAPYVAQGVKHVIFGDLYLRDIRQYREERLASVGMRGVFPLWDEPTDALAREMIAGGLEARLTCIDPRKLPLSFAGRAFDRELLRDLPNGVDPCGENGEFHTCVTAGPMFRAPIAVSPGIVTERDGFCFADFILARSALATSRQSD